MPSQQEYNRVRVEDLLNNTPSRGRTSRRNGAGMAKADIFAIECDAPSCTRKFATLEAVLAHKRRVHAQPTTFVCCYCQSSFSTSPNLNKHIRSVHNKLKPFKCKSCEATFGFRDGLQRHTRMVHDQIRPFSCPHCALKFKTKAHLTKHSLSLHPEAHRSSAMHQSFVTNGQLSHPHQQHQQQQYQLPSFNVDHHRHQHVLSHRGSWSLLGASVARPVTFPCPQDGIYPVSPPNVTER